MSRSFKHNPGYKDKSRYFQKYYNRVIRHTKDIPNGMAYKKFGDQYKITDYKYHYFTREDWRYCWERPWWLRMRWSKQFTINFDWAEYRRPKKLDRCWKEITRYCKNTYREYMK